MTEYRALHSDVEYSAEYRPGGPNLELYIGILNIMLNKDLESESRALHSDVEYSAEYRPGMWNTELYKRHSSNSVLSYIDLNIE